MDEKILRAELPEELFMGATAQPGCNGDGCNSDQGGCTHDADCGQDCSCGSDI